MHFLQHFHRMKNVQIQSFLVSVFPYSGGIQENMDQNKLQLHLGLLIA